ncbi:hypothetical protein BHM03_00058728, partial [Ensete ventricosum]
PLTPVSYLKRTATIYGDCPSVVYNRTTAYTWPLTHRRCLRPRHLPREMAKKTGSARPSRTKDVTRSELADELKRFAQTSRMCM